MDTDQINELLAEVGPLAELDTIQIEDGGTWYLSFAEDEPVCMMEQGAHTGQFLLSSKVAALPDTGADAIMRTAMIYNFQGPQTGGARLALNEADGCLYVLGDLTAGDLEPQTLAELLTAFRTLRQGWQNAVEDWRPAAEDTAAPAPLPPAGMMV